MEQPQAEERVETSTLTNTSIEGRKKNREANILLKDARENAGEPTSQCRHRRSPYWYIGYMALMSELVETKPSSFKEVV